MSIEKNIERIADALEKIVSLNGNTSVVAESVTAEIPPAPKKKAAKKAPKPVEAPAEVHHAPPPPVVVDDAPTLEITLVDLRKMGKRVLDAGKGKDLRTKIRELGAEKLTNLDASHYEAIVSFMKELLGE